MQPNSGGTLANWVKANKKWAAVMAVDIVLLAMKLMTYGHTTIFVDVPMFTLAGILVARYRREIAASAIRKIHWPRYLLGLLVSLPFMIFEENVNCLSTGCVPIPPTIPILFIFGAAASLVVFITKPKDSIRPAVIYGICGLLFEVLVGGLRGVPAFSPISLFFYPWTVFGYAFIALIQFSVIIYGRERLTINPAPIQGQTS